MRDLKLHAKFDIIAGDLKPEAAVDSETETNSLKFSVPRYMSRDIRPLAVRCDPRDHERSRSLGAFCFFERAA